MSKTLRYLAGGQDFKFPSGFGFSGSSTGRDDAKDQPLTPEQQGLEFGLKGNYDNGDDGTYVAKLANGGSARKKLAHGGGEFSKLRSSDGDWTDQLINRGRLNERNGMIDPTMSRRPPAPEPRSADVDEGALYQGRNRDDDSQKLARGGLAKRRPAMRKPMALPQAPGPSPAAGMSPMAQAMSMPGAGRATAAQPPVQNDDGMAKGGRARFAKGGRACYGGGGGVDASEAPQRRMAPPTTAYADESDRRGAPSLFYAGEAERGRMGDRTGPAPKAVRKQGPPRPLPTPPAYEPPPRRGTVDVDVRPRVSRPGPIPPDAPPNPGGGFDPAHAYVAGAATGGHISAARRQALPKSDFALPGQGSGPKGAGSGAYPIDTPGRARAALSRGAANASSADDATIRRRVASKYPDMAVKK